MRQINPAMSDRLAKEAQLDPINEDRETGRVMRKEKQMDDALNEKAKYRLYQGADVCGCVVECYPMEANAWNRNAKAYYMWQKSLGRELLPVLHWKKENDETQSPMWRVNYKENGKNKQRLVCALTPAKARREFNEISSIHSVVTSIERDDEE